MNRLAILQTGRLGDLWFTLPAAHHFHSEGYFVDVVYDSQYGDPFRFAPYVTGRPTSLREVLPLRNRWGYAVNQAINQVVLNRRLQREYSKVIWNQIFPCRWWKPLLRNQPYPCLWYESLPINFRSAPLTIPVKRGQTILVFSNSQSLRFKKDLSYDKWVYENLKKIVEVTGLAPVYVAFGNEKDHPTLPTWRGSLDEYQLLVGQCGLVYGTSTSAHVLALLLRKPFVILYANKKQIYNTIGDEDIKLFPYESLSNQQLDKVAQKVKG